MAMNTILQNVILTLIFVCLTAGAALAQTTEFIYQGQLQSSAAPATGNFDFEFLLYDSLSGGTQVGATLTRSSVAVANGIFSVKLDFGANFPGANRFLEIHVIQTGGGAFTPLTPRQAVSSAPYAVKSLNADNATNATTATTALNATNAVNATNAATAVTATTATNATQLNGQLAGFYQNASNLNNGTLAVSRLPVPFTLTGTDATSIIRGDNAATTSSARGILGFATGTTGTTIGVQGQSNSTLGVGVFGAAASTTGVTYGVLGQTNSSSAPVTPTQNNVPAGVYGRATVTSGFNVGVLGYTPSTDGAGVAGLTSAVSGLNAGVFGSSPSTSGAGVRGEATATSGSNAGVSGLSNSPNGYGVFSFGTLGASGVKTFRIDHPDDPTNKYLLHYSTESPEVINFYRGTIVLDSKGEAVVELPQYFAKINKDPSYMLTAVGAPMPMLYVAKEIDADALKAGAKTGPEQTAPLCSFYIAGGAPGYKVSWRIDAVRNDLWVRSRNPEAEVEKMGSEKGTYQHPDLYGQPAEKGINYKSSTNIREVGARPIVANPIINPN